MNIILSNTLNQEDYINFQVKSKLEDVICDGSIDVLVIHNVDESMIQYGLLLTRCKSKGVKKFIYITENPKEIIKSFIEGVGGVIFTEEEYVSEENLEYLIENYDELNKDTGLALVESIDVISDFVQGFSQGDTRVNSEAYQERVYTALSEIKGTTESAELALKDMSESTIQLFTEMSHTFSNMYAIRQQLTDKLAKMQAQIMSDKRGSSNARQIMRDSINFYPAVSYVGNSKVLHIKERSECRYLLSFLMGYQDYLVNRKSLKAKVIVCYVKSKDAIRRYESLCQISSETIAYKGVLSKPVFAVNQPKRDLLNKVLGAGEDVYIVLDRMMDEDIITGASVHKLNATSGEGAIKRFGLKEQTCILPIVETENSFITIPTIENYPTDEQSRKMAYFSVCKELYYKLDKFLEV